MSTPSKSVAITIIIPCHNDGIFLYDTLDSLNKQTTQDFEIIIIDDASTDSETKKILQNLNQDNLQVIYLDKNSGPAVARNTGIELAQGTYILPVDADDKIGPTYLEKAKDILDAKKNIGIVYCKAEVFGEVNGEWELPSFEFPKILVSNMIFATAMYRKSDWSTVGGYNANMVHGYEDYDFWLSLLELKREVYQIDEILFHYRMKTKSRSSNLKDEQKLLSTFQQLYLNHKKLYDTHTDFILQSTIKNEQKATKLHHDIEYQKSIVMDKNKHIDTQKKNMNKIIYEKNVHINNQDKSMKDLNQHIDDLNLHTTNLTILVESMRLKNRFKRLIPNLLWKILAKMKLTLNPKQPKSEIVSSPQTNYVYIQPTLTDTIKKEINNFTNKPLISIIMPVYNVTPKWLDLAITSIESQWYINWELCMVDDKSTNEETLTYLHQINHPKIKITFLENNQNISGASNAALTLATGDYIALMDNDDELTPDALYEVVKAINTGAEFIYSDEDKIEMNGTFSDPHFKPNYAPDLFLSQNYLSHLGVIKKDLIIKANGFTVGLEGSQDFDLYLKVLEHTNKIHHIQKVLYHWRKIPGSTASEYGEKSYAQEAGKKALESAMQRRGINATVKNGLTPGTYKINYAIKSTPLVSIVIPFKDKPELLKICIESILYRSSYQNFEIIGISNNSNEPSTFDEMERLEDLDERIAFYEYNVPFNYSQINNYAVNTYAQGEQILFLNNDIEVITPTWIEEMLMYSQQKQNGAIGAKLYFPNDTIQHAGLILVPTTIHSVLLIYQEYPKEHYGYISKLKSVNNYSAVTAACLMLKRSIFDKINGFDEENLSVAYNDVDLCLRIQEAGYHNVWTPYAEAYHHESISRGHEKSVEDVERREREKWHLKDKHPEIFSKGDPFYNPNLSRFSVGSEIATSTSKAHATVEGSPFHEERVLTKSLHKKQKERVSIFSHFDAQNEIKDDVLFYLKMLSKISDIVFVSTAEELSSDEIASIEPYCKDIIVKKNIGYDFGAWKTGLDYLAESLEEYDSLILCNDSVYGPLFDLETIMTSMQSYDFWSMTDNYEIEYHLQSYFVVYHKTAFMHSVFQTFWENFKIYEDKQTLIEHNEIAFSQDMMHAGLSYHSYYSVKDKNYVNVLQYHWDTLIQEHQFPFIKKELLKRNPLGLPIDHWSTMVQSVSDYDITVIQKQLNS